MVRYLLAALFVLAVSQTRGEQFTISIVPQFPATEIHKAWTPLLDRLSATTGHRFELLVSPSIPAFEADFLAGRPDIIYGNPYHAVMAQRARAYEPLVRSNAARLTGILVVRADSPLSRVAQLSDSAVAFPAPNAFGASLYMRALLSREHGIKVRASYVKSHTNAYRAVLLGDAVAAGGIRSTFERESAELRSALRVLYETPPVAPHPLAAHPRVAASHRTAIANAILEFDRDPAGTALLQSVQLNSPVRARYAQDYQPLEKLGLDEHVIANR